MSHTTKIKGIKIVSIPALEAAVKFLNENGVRCSLKKDAVPRAYYPNQPGLGRAPYVLHLDDCTYDVGLYESDDGTKGLEARTDFWNGRVEKVLGAAATSNEVKDQAKLGKLFHAYALHATMHEMKRLGKNYRVQSTATGHKLVASY